jgi:hypothetical protein
VAQVGDGNIQGIGHARTALLGRTGGALTCEIDAQPIAADRTEVASRQAKLSGQEFDRRGVARAT